MGQHNLRLAGLLINRGAIDCVAARRISAIRPIEDAIFQIEFEINRLRQAVEQHFDIAAVSRALALRDFDIRA
jgi:hypothetical protein